VPDDHFTIAREKDASGIAVEEVVTRESTTSHLALRRLDVQSRNPEQKEDSGIEQSTDGDKPPTSPKIVWTGFGISFNTPEKFSGRVRQLKFQKDPKVETDVVVFNRYKREYYEAIDPWNRVNLTNRYVVRVVRYIESTWGLKSACNWISAVRRFCWYWFFGFLYRILNFWDLSSIYEVNVLSHPLDSTNSLAKRFQMAGR
jgi:hypothetical protein